MDEEKRARRRRDKERMKARARWVYSRIWSTGLGWTREEAEDHARRAERWADHIKVCSCDGCGNPRRSGWSKTAERITMQERKFLCDDGE